MKKYILAFALFNSFGFFPQTQAQLNDIQSSPYKSGIEYVYQAGIVKGYGDGSFKPYQKINRAEFTKIIIGAQFTKSQIQNCQAPYFFDVPQNAWFSPYICVARQNGIIQGYNDGSFRPEKEISFAESAKIITKSFSLPTEQASPWYKPFVDTLGEKRAIPLSIKNFEHLITREEVSEMIYRLKNHQTSFKSQNYALLNGVDTKISSSENALYLDYTPRIFSKYYKKRNLVLFFHANWCPSCRSLEKEILQNIKNLPKNSVILKINYDSEKNLKEKYKIITQHTGVFIDQKGTVIETVIGFDMADTQQFLLNNR